MTTRSKTASNGRPLTLEDLTLEDLESIRLLLRGGSVIDWHHLDFRNHSDVDRFLRVNEFDPASEDDMSRLEEIRLDAVDYLTRNFDFRIPDAVADGVPARDLFLMASRKGRRQVWACVVLKVMHIANHLAGRELSTRLPISNEDVYRTIELKVMRVVEELRAAGYPIREFEWSRKTRDSQITKLLAKRSTLAASIYDKLRFRLVLRNRHDIMPMLAALTRRLIPFNYIVPGASVNHLINFHDAIRQSQSLQSLTPELQLDHFLEKQQDKAAQAPINEFSGKNYRIVNFVADLPLRVDQYVGDLRDFGTVVFVMTEFQIVDKATTVDNERGESSHDAYKARQHRSVRLRLMRGRRVRPSRRSEDE